MSSTKQHTSSLPAPIPSAHNSVLNWFGVHLLLLQQIQYTLQIYGESQNAVSMEEYYMNLLEALKCHICEYVAFFCYESLTPAFKCTTINKHE